MNKKIIISIFVGIILSMILTLTTASVSGNRLIAHNDIKNANANLIYRVYLEGKSIGIIKSKEELENYIDSKQEEIKKKYNVDKVYAPNDLDIVREYTYNERISTIEQIYNKIKELKGSEAFTINGYKITIEGIDEETEDGIVKEEDVVIYVLDKTIFDEASKDAITAFIDSKSYNDYLNDTQEKIKDLGSIIQNLYIENNVSIVNEKIPTGENIYTSREELSQFLLFGSENEKQSYTVKDGDTIEDVAEANKMSPEEFLIANTNFNTKNDLLYPGQIVTLGILSPKFKLIEERYVVEERTIEYEVTYQDDPDRYVGYESVVQEGVSGLEIVTEIQKYVNGEFKDKSSIDSIVTKPSINKIIKRGTKRNYASLGPIDVPVGIGSWVWPTNPGYYITSNFGWRWGKMHEGIDITGTGYGSPIKAANNGIVVASKYDDYNGNYIYIAHSNGYYTMYGHMAKRYKSVGDIVYAGDVIGAMGDTGFATGTHVHFGLSAGYPYRSGSRFLNPTTLYR